MKMILTAGALGLALMLAAIGTVHAKKAPSPPDDSIAQPILIGE